MIYLIKILPKSFRDHYRPQWRKLSQEFQIICGKIKRQFIRPPFPKLEDGSVNLHLGCGSVYHPKFINIDGLPAPHVHYVRVIDDLSPFGNKSVDLIYACHCLEHFPHGKVPEVLSEWFRVLKDGGVLRLSVPNFDLLLDIYKENGRDINTILGIVMGNQNYKFNFHMTIFNRSSLQDLLKTTGFKHVQEWQPSSCELTTFDDYSNYTASINSRDYPVSLNVEAVK
jgi:predicted SAM-dependent methyltransferase